MKRLIPLICLLLLLTIIGCTNNSEKLEARITELEKELDECRNGADKIYGKLQNAFDSEKHEEVVSLYTNLLDKHPGALEASNAKEIAKQSKEILDRLESEKVAEKVRLELLEKARVEKAEKEKLASLNKLKKKYDDISGITWYYQPYFTHYTNTNRVSIHIGKKENTVWVNLMMSYTGEDWIFFKHAYLSYDGNTEEIHFDDYKDKKTDNDGGVWEWITISDINSSLISFLENFAKSPNAKVRFSGKYTDTRTLTVNERKGITDVINGYNNLRN